MTSSAETARYVHRNVTRFNHVNVATAFHTLARLRRAGGGAPASNSKRPPPAAAAEEGEEAAALLLAGRAEELVLDFAPQERYVAVGIVFALGYLVAVRKLRKIHGNRNLFDRDT